MAQYTAAQAAKLVGVAKSTLILWIQQGKLAETRSGKFRLIEADDLAKLKIDHKLRRNKLVSSQSSVS